MGVAGAMMAGGAPSVRIHAPASQAMGLGVCVAATAHALVLASASVMRATTPTVLGFVSQMPALYASIMASVCVMLIWGGRCALVPAHEVEIRVGHVCVRTASATASQESAIVPQGATTTGTFVGIAWLPVHAVVMGHAALPTAYANVVGHGTAVPATEPRPVYPTLRR
jgi:hypothetical protein